MTTNETSTFLQIRERLLERREALVDRVKRELEEETDLVSERDPDWEDLAVRQGLADLVDRMSERDLHELARIDSALSRIGDGTYGRCTSCGEAITIDRLLALPEADECTECAERDEAAAAR